MTEFSPEAYYKHGTSLALYRPIGEMKDYWEAYWGQDDLKPLFDQARQGRLGEFEYPFSKYLPRDGVILEAGCGKGKYVCALQARGYRIEGLDYAVETIERIRQAAPDLNVRVGDIYAIDRPDGHYDAYISIGVMEHNFDGPEAALAEAYRVLCPGGIALITVPYLNFPRRRLYRRVPEMHRLELGNGLRFYQDHVNVDHFANCVQRAGFTILDRIPYGLLGGLVRDWRLGRWLYSHHFFFYRVYQLISRSCKRAPLWLRKDLSHMLMFVCQK
ncbi:MAG: class I SAM-dependent methyltransferase [Anaerolineales bacterium]|nr:class I SAM-dependent methyltransferase [Anaerolineales bacterium]